MNSSSLSVMPPQTTADAGMVRDLPRYWVLGLALWSVVVAAGSAGFAVHLDRVDLQRNLVLRPPVVVIDTMDWVQNAGTGHTLSERYQNGAARMKATVEELKKRGAIVIDSSVLHTYPDDVKLDPTRAEPSK